MFVYVPHRRHRNLEIELEPGERKLGSYIVGATGYSWVFAGTGVLILAMGLGYFLSRDGVAGAAIASVFSANMMLFSALGKRRLTLTDRRLVLQRGAKIEQSLPLGEISGIEVQGNRIGRVCISARRGDVIRASVFVPLKVAGEIQSACAAIEQDGKTVNKGGRE